MLTPPVIRRMGLQAYEPTWVAMQRFTELRDASTPDEIWFVEHPPIFTLGLNASREHLLAPGEIPVLKVDRGGEVTYHGPGQLLLYPLIDLRRRGFGVRTLVVALERAVIAYAAQFGVAAISRRDAPGVYVDGRKLASVGLRVRRGASYHGLALNVSVELEPFERINVCGYRGLEATRLCDLCAAPSDLETTGRGLEPHLLRELGAGAAEAGAAEAGAAEAGAAEAGAAEAGAAEAGAAEAARYSAMSTDLQAVNSR
jgi:lipoyl(octanoyl) transferase